MARQQQNDSTMDKASMNSDVSEFKDVKKSHVVSEVIRDRRTAKVLVKPSQSVLHPHDDCVRLNQLVLNAVQDAGFAPFHYDRNENGIAEPWRFYILWQGECRYLGENLGRWFSDVKPNNKLPAMLSACGCLVLVYWLPQFENGPKEGKQLQVDEEHLAATAAATQNLLLSLTASALKTYWSSGGFFRSNEMKYRLGIPVKERLLSAVFVDYGAEQNAVETISGKQHDVRSTYEKWTRELTLEEIEEE